MAMVVMPVIRAAGSKKSEFLMPFPANSLSAAQAFVNPAALRPESHPIASYLYPSVC
jgi:hypothetical protein